MKLIPHTVKVNLADDLHLLVEIIGESLYDFSIESVTMVDHGKESVLEGLEDGFLTEIKEWTFEALEKENKEYVFIGY